MLLANAGTVVLQALGLASIVRLVIWPGNPAAIEGACDLLLQGRVSLFCAGSLHRDASDSIGMNPLPSVFMLRNVHIHFNFDAKICSGQMSQVGGVFFILKNRRDE